MAGRGGWIQAKVYIKPKEEMSFQKLGWMKNQDMVAFVAELEKEYNLAKVAGCIYSDKMLALYLLEVENLSEIKEKLVHTAVDFKRGDLTEQVKVSLKRFHDRVVMLVNKKRIKKGFMAVSKMEDF